MTGHDQQLEQKHIYDKKSTAVPDHATKAYKGRRGTALLILNPDCFTPRERAPGT